MTRSRLADLVEGRGRGVGLASGALLGATVAVATSWLKGDRLGFFGDAVLGASVGAVCAAAGNVISDALTSSEEARLSAAPTSPALAEATRTGLAPYGFYRPSLTYPWSEF